ncbi:hypothetical protein ACFLWY_00620 [Chloroflexota bacterium]
MVVRVSLLLVGVTLLAGLISNGCIEQEPPFSTPPVLQPESEPKPAYPEPDTGKIAFESERDGNPEIYIINADGSNLTRLTNNSFRDESPVLSPDGSKIAFMSAPQHAGAGISLMNADGTNLVKLTDNLSEYDDIVWSPDGTTILFRAEQDNNIDIYAIDADGSNQNRLTDTPGCDWAPAWSPDGTKIAFTRGCWLTDPMPGGSTDIWVMNSDGSNQTKLTTRQTYSEYPYWSPDGNRIVFTGSIDGRLQICVINADGTNQTNLSQALTSAWVADRFPKWSPDGTKIAFVRDFHSLEHPEELFVMNTDGSNQTRLADWPPYYQSFSWSPDGAKIAFVSRCDSNLEIYVANADGSNKFRLTDNPARDYMISWSR